MPTSNIPRLRLHNQCLTRHPARSAGELVAHMGAVQAQDFAGGKWGIGARLRSATEADVEAAIARREIVRTWPMRGTLHFVAAADVRWMLALLTPRIERESAGRFRQLELDERTIARAGEVFERALAGGKSVRRTELLRLLEENGISTADYRGVHLLGRHSQRGLICGAAPDGKQHTFALLEEWVAPGRALEGDAAREEVARRYFTSHGPATVADLSWWSGLTMREARAGVELAGDSLRSEEIGGQVYWLADAKPRKVPSPDVHLLPPFDEYTVAYRDRSAVLAPEYSKHASDGGIFKPIVVVDGQVVGTWRRSAEKGTTVVTATPFAGLGAEEWRALEGAAERYGAFLGAPVEVRRG